MERYKDEPHLKGNYDHYCLGVLYYLNNQLVLAGAEFEKQLQLDSNFADTYYYLGLIEEKNAEHHRAEGFFKKALAKMNGIDGGYSMNLFAELNISKEIVEKSLTG